MKHNILQANLYKSNKIQTLLGYKNQLLKLISIRSGAYNSRFLKSDILYWDWWVENEKIRRGNIPRLYKDITAGRGKTAVDVGCGNGFYSEILRNNGYDVVCLDRSKKALEIVSEKGFKTKKIDIKNFYLENDEIYDVISCMGVLHHVVDDNSVENALKVMNNHCDFLVLGVRNDLYDSYKFKRRPLSFYANIVKGDIIQTNSYLDIIIN